MGPAVRAFHMPSPRPPMRYGSWRRILAVFRALWHRGQSGPHRRLIAPAIVPARWFFGSRRLEITWRRLV